ncbi:MAG: hypothetical protein HUJ31_17990 [Pseudomonadales bacterium]|nr:hypothetical protein [Pseudomonadales bacterium]
MKRRILKLSPHKTALTLALTFALVSIFLLILMALMLALGPSPAGAEGNSMGPGFFGFLLIIMPIIYFVSTYIFTALMAWIYNYVARFSGGIEYESDETA